MTAQVANAALVGSAARISRAFGASSRPLVEQSQGASAAPGREGANPFEDVASRFEPGSRRRRAEFQDQVVSFGGVLVSQDVGNTIVEAQSQNGLYPTPPAEAERQVANYEFVQSLFGPAEPILIPAPFPQ